METVKYCRDAFFFISSLYMFEIVRLIIGLPVFGWLASYMECNLILDGQLSRPICVYVCAGDAALYLHTRMPYHPTQALLDTLLYKLEVKGSDIS